MINYKKINKCQISNSNKLDKILSLGLIPPVNQMSHLNSKLNNQTFFPTELFYCPKSRLVQLGIEVNKKILFPKEYPYTSSTTKVLGIILLNYQRNREILSTYSKRFDHRYWLK